MITTVRKHLFPIFFAIAVCASVGVAFADLGGSTAVVLTNPLNTTSFIDVVNKVIVFLTNYIAIPLTTIMVLVGGFQMITSSGDPEKVSQSRKTLVYAAVGFGIVLLASSVSYLIKNILGA